MQLQHNLYIIEQTTQKRGWKDYESQRTAAARLSSRNVREATAVKSQQYGQIRSKQ